MTPLIVVVCALLSGAGMYFSLGLGEVWALAWLAPIPVLWLAFGGGRCWVVFLAAFAAGVIGGCNILPAYFHRLPPLVLVIAIAGPALAFAGSVAGAQFVGRRVAPILGVIVFATLWTAFDYLISFGANGTALSPAYSQVGMPFFIQAASVFGLWIVTFVIGFFASSAAMFAATRERQFAFLAVAVFALNAGYGVWRMDTAPKTAVTHVGLAADDALVGKYAKGGEDDELDIVKAYADTARMLSLKGSSLIVFPEKVAALKPAWHGAAMAELETAAHIGHATIVIGFDEYGATRRNTAMVFFPSGAPPQSYHKRHMVPVLEGMFVPGEGSFMLADRTGVAICKDMDFPETLRADATLAPTLFAVPAWDFDRDAWWHARLAIMRGVENGFAVARAANDGLLTLTDAYGRLLGSKASAEGGMVTLQGDLPRGPGVTLFARVGDAFAWICSALSLLLLFVAVFARRRA
jgi:apolipoprotein N-acyltransferase